MLFYRFDIATIIIILAVLYSLSRNKSIITNTVKSFSVIIFSCLFCSIFDLTSSLMTTEPEKYSQFLLYLSKVLYQLAYHTIPVAFYFCSYFISEDNKVPSTKKIVLLMIPYYVTVLLVITSPLTKVLFYFDENNIYNHGIIYPFLYFEALFYALISLRKLNKHKPTSRKLKFLPVLIYSLIIITFILVQNFFPQVRIMCFIISVSIILGFLSLENPASYEELEMGIYNKYAFKTNIKNSIENKKVIYILNLKILGLDYIFNFLGRENYSYLITNISDYLKTRFDPKNLYRISLNSIAIILDEDHEERTRQILALEKRQTAPFKCKDTEVFVSFELNQINLPEDVNNYDELIELLDNADVDLFSTKQSMSAEDKRIALEKNRRENHIITLLDKAIREDGFDVFYQPIYSITSHRFTSAEALIRLKNSDIGYISPEEFIPIAEKNGMIFRIGKIVFTKVCHFLSTYKPWNYGINQINVNLSSIQFMQNQFSYYFFQILNDYNLNSKYIGFEVSASSAGAANKIIQQNMDELKKNNMIFYLDSYGIGNATINNLMDFPFSYVKFDKKLIWEALADEKAKIILKETISMIKSLNISVVAEGVENHEQAIELIQMSCDLLEGYYYSEPLPPQQFFQFIKNR